MAAEQNIHRYAQELLNSKPLRDRAAYARAWYADQDSGGRWSFAPSKFVGYQFASAEEYIAASGKDAPPDGRMTERALEQWFEVVPLDSRLGQDLLSKLRAFLAAHGQAPNERVRISVSKNRRPANETARAFGARNDDALLSRIVSNPGVCGGRPCIKGTRMRVSDIVDMLAHGATRSEILEDFDYITDEDITAALYYAARAADHRVIQAA